MSRSKRLMTTRVGIDLATILAALSCSGIWAGRADQSPWQVAGDVAAHAAVFGAVWTMATSRLGTYQVPVQRNLARALRRMTEAWATTWGIAGLLTVSILGNTHLDIWMVLVVGLLAMTAIRLMLSKSPLAQGVGHLRTLVIGSCSSARSLTSAKDSQHEVELLGFVPFAGEDHREMPHLSQVGSIDTLAATLVEQRADLVMVCPSERAVTGEVHRVFQVCDELGMSIQYFPSFLDLQHLRVGLSWSASRPGLSFHTLPNQTFAQLAKRAIDVVGATVGIIALLPAFLVSAIAVKATSRGPVFFPQTRVGKNGETFSCLKFRTMRVGAHAQQELLRSASTQDGPAFKIPHDPRITPAGRLLRKFSLDELPQLFNVLVGDMSLVGPRPPIPSEVEKYSWWQRRRISVKPGLTCVWQVWGRNRVSFKRWVEMDLYYIDNWSLWLDLKLIMHTFRTVLAGTGM
jgi:exopolysaccharide biosynthesis polyprenyl glycosylphosphotransferase